MPIPPEQNKGEKNRKGKLQKAIMISWNVCFVNSLKVKIRIKIFYLSNYKGVWQLIYAIF